MRVRVVHLGGSWGDGRESTGHEGNIELTRTISSKTSVDSFPLGFQTSMAKKTVQGRMTHFMTWDGEGEEIRPGDIVSTPER